MKFIVTSTSLLKSLKQINGVISSNIVLAVLEDFLFELNDNTLTITATDLETMMKVNLVVTAAKGNGKICVPSKILMEYLQNLPEQPITFNIDVDDLSIEISSQMGNCHIGGVKHDDFPREQPQLETTAFTVPANALVEGISKTIFSVSADTLRPAMTGVFFELAYDCITFVATDAHRLVEYKRTDVSCPEIAGFVVPKKPLQQLKNNLPNDETQITVSYNDNFLFVSCDTFSLNCRLIDAKFPDYKAVVPRYNSYTVTINRLDFVSALKRVSVFSNKTTNQVMLHINKNLIEISSEDIDFSYDGMEKMSCQYVGKDMKIAFNAKLLLEIATNIKGSELLIELSSPSRAGILKQIEKNSNEEILMLMMPLMIN